MLTVLDPDAQHWDHKGKLRQYILTAMAAKTLTLSWADTDLPASGQSTIMMIRQFTSCLTMVHRWTALVS